MARPAVTSQEAIVASALDLLDAVGDEQFTMRALAEKLGVSHAALFRHIADKDELITLVIDRQLGVALQRATASDPISRLRQIGTSLRDEFDEHPNLLRPFINSAGSGKNAEKLGGLTAATLIELGLSRSRLTYWLRVFENLVVGGAVFDNAAAPRHLEVRAQRLNRLYDAGLIGERVTPDAVAEENRAVFIETLDLLLAKLQSEVKVSAGA
jgi:AcrR family transcriptional regulator